MDFFDDDFGFPSNQFVKLQEHPSKKSQSNKSIRQIDHIDDLLNDFVDTKKQNISKINKLRSSTSLIDNIRSQPLMTTKKILSYTDIDIVNKNIPPDITKTYQLNKQSSQSLFDDKASDDNISFKSGVGGYNKKDSSWQLNKNNDGSRTNQKVYSTSSIRSQMKPPIRKKIDNRTMEQEVNNYRKQNHQFPQEIITSMKQIESPNPIIRPLGQKKQVSTSSKLGIAPSPPLYSLQLNDSVPFQIKSQQGSKPLPRLQQKSIRQQHEREIKLLKQTYEKQIVYFKQQLHREMKSNKQQKLGMMKEFEVEREKERKLQDEIWKSNYEKVKDVHAWQIRKKSETYQLQIQKLKKINEMTSKTHHMNDNLYRQYEKEKQQLSVKQKQLEIKTQKLSDKQRYLQQKQSTLEIRQLQFDKYRKNQQQKLQQQKKEVYKMETQLQKQKLLQRKQYQQSKIHLCTDLSKNQKDIYQIKQTLKIDKQSLEFEKQLFQKQKLQYLEFNNCIINDYKNKIQLLENQKISIREKQIQLWKKIHVVQMMGNFKINQKKLNKEQDKYYKDYKNINIELNKKQPYTMITFGNNNYISEQSANPSKKQNNPTQTNQQKLPPQHQNIQLSQQKYPQQIKDPINPKSKHKQLLNRSDPNLKQYLSKMNKNNNNRMKPFLL